MHLVAEIIFIFLIVYLTGSSSVLQYRLFLFFHLLSTTIFTETWRNKIDKKVPALYIISSLKMGNIQRGKKVS